MTFKLSIADLAAVTSHISCVSNVLLLPMLGNFYQKVIPRHARHVRLLTLRVPVCKKEINSSKKERVDHVIIIMIEYLGPTVSPMCHAKVY